jgi:hypothetical protein
MVQWLLTQTCDMMLFKGEFHIDVGGVLKEKIFIEETNPTILQHVSTYLSIFPGECSK